MGKFVLALLAVGLLGGCETLRSLDPHVTAGLTSNGATVAGDVGSASVSTTGAAVEVETEEFTVGFSVTACVGRKGFFANAIDRYLGSFGDVVNNFITCPEAERPSL